MIKFLRLFYIHSSVGLSTGDLISMGGNNDLKWITDIWLLKAEDASWSKIGDLLAPMIYHSTLRIGSSVYVIPGRTDIGSDVQHPIQRIDFDGLEIVDIEIIEYQTQDKIMGFYRPAVMQVQSDFCLSK